MAGLHILTDSSTVLPGDAALAYGIRIVPHLGDGDDVPGPAGAPTWAPPAAYEAAMRGALAQGVAVLALHGPTWWGPMADDARSARARLPAAAPVQVLELPFVGPALGLLALGAALVGAEGEGLEAVAAWASARVPTTGQCLLSAFPGRWLGGSGGPETREPGPAAAGGWTLLSQAGGRPRRLAGVADGGGALRALADAVAAEAGGPGLQLGLAGVDSEAAAAALATYLQTRLQPLNAWVAPAGPLFAASLGAGALAVAWTGAPGAGAMPGRPPAPTP